jgi:zinc protease
MLALMLSLGMVNAVSARAVHEYTLDNGLKLIVKEDHRAPVMVSQVWYRVGSSYEHDGITGVSHVLEHMMFKGTADHPAGEFSQIISENGGSENAFTSSDYTAYFQTMEASRLPVSFELEADRMRNLSIPEDEFLKEIQVVMEERRMRTEDNPQALTYEQFNAAAYASSPYRIPVIGWMDDLQNMSVADLRDWYKQWYAPNNAIVVVVGDVKPDEVLRLAQKYFGPLRPEPLSPPKPRLEIKQLGRKAISVAAPAKLPYLMMGYKVPVAMTAGQDWEPYALEVLTSILDGGESARLASELVRGSSIAASASASYSAFERMSSLFVIAGTPANGNSVAELQLALHQQLDRLTKTPVSKTELARVKAQLRAEKVYEQDSIFYQAMQLGVLETIGLSWKDADEYLPRIEAVTAEQVQEVARKYLVEDALTVAELAPQPIDPEHPPTTSAGDAYVH